MKLRCDMSCFECVMGAKVPKVDRGRGDTPSVLAQILERQEGFCQLGLRSGILTGFMLGCSLMCVCVRA